MFISHNKLVLFTKCETKEKTITSTIILLWLLVMSTLCYVLLTNAPPDLLATFLWFVWISCYHCKLYYCCYINIIYCYCYTIVRGWFIIVTCWCYCCCPLFSLAVGTKWNRPTQFQPKKVLNKRATCLSDRLDLIIVLKWMFNNDIDVWIIRWATWIVKNDDFERIG